MYHLLYTGAPDAPMLTIPFNQDTPDSALAYGRQLINVYPDLTFWRVDEISTWDNTRVRIVHAWHRPTVTRQPRSAMAEFLAMGQ